MLVTEGGRRLMNPKLAEPNMGLSVQDVKDLCRASRLPIPFSGDYSTPLWQKSVDITNKSSPKTFEITDMAALHTLFEQQQNEDQGDETKRKSL